METHRLSEDEQGNYFKSFVQALVQKFKLLSIFCFCRMIHLLEISGCIKNRRSMHYCQDHLLMFPQPGFSIKFTLSHLQHTAVPP